MQVSEYTEPVGDEIKLIIILAVSILILLSVFGLGGRVGDKAAYLFFGLFGFVAYALPFLLFIGSAFHISNRGSRLARIKLTAATVFLIMIMALMALADSSFDGTASVLDGFLNSAAAHNGGGLIGFSLSWVLFNAFGRAGSTVILVCLMLVSGVLITGKRIFIRLGTLIGHMMNDMGQHFNAWREKRARERLARMEAKAAEEDSLPEDEAYEDIDEETVSIQPKKKAANIIIPSRKKENVKSKDPAPASSSEPVLQTYTEESATSAETAVISDDSKQPSLDSFDQGQSVQPLHIQIPEFMSGHVSGKSSVKAPSASISDIMSNLSRDIPSEAESEPETETVEDKKPKGKPVIARTILSPDDLELEIEGLPEETPVNTDDTFIDISKILSEIPETTGNINTEVADMQPEDVSPAAQAEQQTAVSPTAARTSSPSHHTTAKGTVEDTASDSDEPLEIVEEEIEKYEFPPLDLLDQGKGSGNQQTP
ncbi:MAG: DNA translocase FtsK 4TM domain-containing protein [Coprococcus sp.]